MDYRHILKEENELILERWEMASQRIREMDPANDVPELAAEYFTRTRDFILMIQDLFVKITAQAFDAFSAEELKRYNHRLYEDILPENYGNSYANPAVAADKLGEDYGRLLSFLYAELRGMIVYAYEYRLTDLTILSELFIEVYNMFEEEMLPKPKDLKNTLYWFVSDYSDHTVPYRIRELLDPALSFATDIIRESDLTDSSYLYKYGEYVSDNELRTAEFLARLSEDEVRKIADTYTEGYRIGFVRAGKPLEKKKTVNIRYTLGFERVIRYALENFEKMGLAPVIYRAAVNSINKKQAMKIGYVGGAANRQYDYDHKDDQAIYLDKPFLDRKLGCLKVAYEEMKEEARTHAGPAVMETFGEKPFTPTPNPYALSLSEKQQKLSVTYTSEAGRLANTYIPGDERSFTIIAFPVPEIGEAYEEIFTETVTINTLDYAEYEKIQQVLIDALDKADHVHIKGANGNRTDLTVNLYKLSDPSKETIFENCVADVNIPVGEVFTSPVLEGTNGILHVKKVYLNELEYNDLEIRFEDGRIADYSCGGFDTVEEGKKYIFDNILFGHETLPIGEFAIGTNTYAYKVGRTYGIEDKLPILIAEKMGPHFAVGDTCYSWEEDVRVYNPDGKEIVAKENSVSSIRKEDPSGAYFNCHTDITIPYDELESITAITKSGEKISLIECGRFALKGTEALNVPLDAR